MKFRTHDPGKSAASRGTLFVTTLAGTVSLPAFFKEGTCLQCDFESKISYLRVVWAEPIAHSYQYAKLRQVAALGARWMCAHLSECFVATCALVIQSRSAKIVATIRKRFHCCVRRLKFRTCAFDTAERGLLLGRTAPHRHVGI
jgi:hypothetical protein